MSAKQMSNFALVFLLFAVNAIICELVFGGWLDGVWFFSVISTLFNISSAIKKDLEQIKEKLNHQHNRG